MPPARSLNDSMREEIRHTSASLEDTQMLTAGAAAGRPSVGSCGRTHPVSYTGQPETAFLGDWGSWVAARSRPYIPRSCAGHVHRKHRLAVVH